MKNSLNYPVLSLNLNITKYLSDLTGVEIQQSIFKGLKNQIEFVDLKTSISTVAQITNVEFLNKDVCQVKLSAAYCQYLWFLSDIVLKITDRKILQIGATSVHTNLNNFIKNSLKIFKNNPSRGISKYYECVELFGKVCFKNKILEEASLCDKLVVPHKNIAMKPFQQYKPRGKYEQRVNSVYCYAIALVLLHELGHYDLGHMKINTEEISQEIEADSYALWNMYNNENNRFSMICGILLGFFSLLMLNPRLISDGVHQNEIDRLLEAYNTFKDENEKYNVLYDNMMEIYKCYVNNLNNDNGLYETIQNFL